MRWIESSHIALYLWNRDRIVSIIKVCVQIASMIESRHNTTVDEVDVFIRVVKALIPISYTEIHNSFTATNRDWLSLEDQVRYLTPILILIVASINQVIELRVLGFVITNSISKLSLKLENLLLNVIHTYVGIDLHDSLLSVTSWETQLINCEQSRKKNESTIFLFFAHSPGGYINSSSSSIVKFIWWL